MLLAIVALATSPDPGISGGFELQPGPYPLRLNIYAEGPIPERRPIRLATIKVLANGQKQSFRLEPAPGSDLTMAKGTTRHRLNVRLVPSPSGAWIDGTFRISVGNAPAQPFSLYQYFPPTDAGDAELQRIRAHYVGKKVWPYGGDVAIGIGGHLYRYFTGLRPLRVLNVERGNSLVGAQFASSTLRPLVVTFAPIDKAEIGQRDEWRRFEAQTPLSGKRSPVFLRVDTGLMLSEAVSLNPPPRWLLKKKGKAEQAMRDFDVNFARKKSDVLWILGPPSLPRVWESAFRQNEWHYSILTPHFHALKFRRGLLVAKTLEGQTP
jgi:hypothetical protein